ncbi:MAG TPA: calcium/proton exchanger [Candidatus Limnocylindrales bacterium]|nr:calcium/proton exchanger [Candidatus Limnocylindrales bacterium]
MTVLGRRTAIIGGVAIVATLLTWGLQVAGVSSVPVFVASAIALAMLAFLVGEATDQLGMRLGPGATGVLQSALGNLPELFISLFALQAGLAVVVQTALVGSILANSLLVLGLAFIFGGLRHGEQKFEASSARMIAVLLLLATSALSIPALATAPGAPDFGHGLDLSVIVSIVLLVVFVVSIPFSIGGGRGASHEGIGVAERWPMPLVLLVLAVAAGLAALTSDWFVAALEPAMGALGISEEFVGLVVVAIAGNAVENVVGVQMAARNKPDLAISLILNSSLQVALALTPALVLLGLFVGPTPLTLVLPPLLIGAVALSSLLGALITVDGKSSWLEGLALVGLYLIVAASTWWGPVAGS